MKSKKGNSNERIKYILIGIVIGIIIGIIIFYILFTFRIFTPFGFRIFNPSMGDFPRRFIE